MDVNTQKIIIWNAQSIWNKRREFFDYMTSENIDIALINETYLNNRLSLSHPKFKIYRLDRPENLRGGGVAIVINRSIKHELLSVPLTTVIEAISLRIFANNTNFIITSAYFPGSSESSVLSQFRQDIYTLTSSSNFIIGGDLNAKHSSWNCVRNNGAGNILYEILMNNNFLLHFPDSPTHFPHSGSLASTIDLFLSQGFPCPHNITTDHALKSDHVTVHCNINYEKEFSNDKHLMKDFSRANWKKFSEIVNHRLTQLSFNFNDSSMYSEAIDDLILQFTNAIHYADEQSIPLRRFSFSYDPLNRETKGLIGLRRAKIRSLRRNYDPLIKEEVNLLTSRINYLISKQINTSFQDSLANINKDPGDYKKKLWKITKFFKKKPVKIPPLKSGPNLLITDQEKSDAFGEYFQHIHDATDSSLNNNVISRNVSSSINQINVSSFPPNSINLITESEITPIINSLKNNKAPGFDEINNRHLKNLPSFALTFLAYIFNVCLLNSYFPQSWKVSKIRSILKPGKSPNEINSYRPISLLSTLGKIFERLILNRLESHLESRNPIPSHQYGFRKGKSCCHQLFRITKYIKENFKSKKSIGLLSIDLQAAFDSVWHQGLLHKLYKINTPMYLIKIIKSFLTNRFLKVSIGQCTSEAHPVSAGVPQGAVLSPTLFNIFLYDIPSDPEGLIGQFADDTAVLAASHSTSSIINKLQKLSDRICRYFKQWRIRINPDKSESMLFTWKIAERHVPQRNIKVNGNDVEWKNNLRYLGVILDPKLTFKAHVEFLISKCNNLIKLLYPIIHRKSKITCSNKLLLFKTIFRPSYSYASPVWSHCAACHLNRIQVLQNKILKMMLDYDRLTPTSFIHYLSEIELVTSHFEKLYQNFLINCRNNLNIDINNLLDST